MPKSRHGFGTGLCPTPAHKVAKATAEGRLHIFSPTVAAPPQVAMVPKRLGMWLNDVDGNCVAAEEAFAVAAYSTSLGLPEVFIPDQSVLDFCNRFGVLNGAELLPVMQDMQSVGLLGSDGKTYYRDGVPSVVDYTVESVLQAAIALGPVKVGIMSSALPDDAGRQNGWSIFSPGENGPEDHCVSLAGYGPASWLAQQLGVPAPPGAPSTAYLLFTWSTIGMVSYSWIRAALAEAYLRSPTTLGLTPSPPPTPSPSPQPRIFGLHFNRDLPANALIDIPPFRSKVAIKAGDYNVVPAAPSERYAPEVSP